MARYLKHFTAVGDDHHSFNKWHEEEFHEEAEEPSLHSITFRDSLRKLFSSHKFQVSVVCLVILDAVFVLCELLLDLAIIKQDDHKIPSQVFHYLSLALLTFFMVELFGKLFAYRLEFFHHKFEVFDGVVVIVSFILDIVYISHEDAFDGVGLLILLRLWRVARIVNGNAAPLELRSPAVLHTGIHAVAVPGDKALEPRSPAVLHTGIHAVAVPGDKALEPRSPAVLHTGIHAVAVPGDKALEPRSPAVLHTGIHAVAVPGDKALEPRSPAVLHTGIHAVAVPGDKALEPRSPAVLHTGIHAVAVPGDKALEPRSPAVLHTGIHAVAVPGDKALEPRSPAEK
ncbi:UNVERIFIED_CONTAM: hypothetical protein FKN15_050212 [Acipenser sinensis]